MTERLSVAPMTGEPLLPTTSATIAILFFFVTVALVFARLW